jgi:hypothetical protein
VQYFGVFDAQRANPELTPEAQQGGEGGIELYFGTRGSLIVTRYNQTVDHLITNVQVDSAQSLVQDPYGYCIYSPIYCGYAYQGVAQYGNIGSLRNQGWEVQGSANLGSFSTRGTYSWNKSRVIGITPAYQSKFPAEYYPQYQKGAVFSHLPEHTWALELAYAHTSNAITLNVMGTGFHYTSYDALYIRSQMERLIEDSPVISLAYNRRGLGPSYATADLNATHRFSPKIEGVLQVQNVGNFYQNDYDARYPVLGRQTKAGLRVRL